MLNSIPICRPGSYGNAKRFLIQKEELCCPSYRVRDVYDPGTRWKRSPECFYTKRFIIRPDIRTAPGEHKCVRVWVDFVWCPRRYRRYVLWWNMGIEKRFGVYTYAAKNDQTSCSYEKVYAAVVMEMLGAALSKGNLTSSNQSCRRPRWANNCDHGSGVEPPPGELYEVVRSSTKARVYFQVTHWLLPSQNVLTLACLGTAEVDIDVAPHTGYAVNTWGQGVTGRSGLPRYLYQILLPVGRRRWMDLCKQ